jgi:hypothetical protein
MLHPVAQPPEPPNNTTGVKLLNKAPGAAFEKAEERAP